MHVRKILALFLLCVINFFHAAPIVFAAYSQAQKITASDGDASDNFGFDVDIEDTEYAIIGAPNDNKPAGTSSGSAYVYYNNGTGSGFAQQAKLEASDKASNDNFGRSVASYNDLVIVGGKFNQFDPTTVGSAYVFRRSDTTWTQKAILSPNNGAVDDGFGYNAVGITGYAAIVGSPGADPSGVTSAGSAYIFTSSNFGETWNQTQILAPAEVVYGSFGYSVDIDGDYAVVGSPSASVSGVATAGKVTIYFFNGSTWTTQATLNASDYAANDEFGFNVSIEGSYVLV